MFPSAPEGERRKMLTSCDSCAPKCVTRILCCRSIINRHEQSAQKEQPKVVVVVAVRWRRVIMLFRAHFFFIAQFIITRKKLASERISRARSLVSGGRHAKGSFRGSSSLAAPDKFALAFIAEALRTLLHFSECDLSWNNFFSPARSLLPPNLHRAREARRKTRGNLAGMSI
jgi:hypothetical protein